ncbi:hypothetical protein L21TH_2080 [Caldisalinibacter kiritimatiensis]|uniref:DUF2154 domain-containing protein n=2 Tax=Caldisalinibacter kiritimatiensis TaxID=1304284 RepID=R1ARV6_9FIRM|nr:hypothetical protein L21TH_2080 [Caldisalinibacter kiritimatiensis]
MKENTKHGNLNLAVGAGNLKISSSKDNLVHGFISNPKVTSEVKYKNNDRDVTVTFKSPNFKTTDFGEISKGDKYDLYLNKEITWDIDADIGAMDGHLDFSNVKIDNLDIDCGASDLEVVFGDTTKRTSVDIDAGVSDVELTFPENVGVKIDLDGGLKNSNLKELNWIRDNDYYISPNYDEADKKIDVSIDLGIGQLVVNVR